MSEDKAWKRVAAEWGEVVLICRKCSKKLGGGFGPDGDETLAKALRRALDDGGGHRVKARRRTMGVVEVGCLDVCPKRAVVVVKGSAPGTMHLVPRGARTDEVAKRLGLRRSAPLGKRVEEAPTAVAGERVTDRRIGDRRPAGVGGPRGVDGAAPWADP